MERVREHSVTGSGLAIIESALRGAQWFCTLALFILVFAIDGYSQSFRLQREITVHSADQTRITDFSPSALSVSANGTLYISDITQNRILKIDASGNVLETRGRFGWQPEEYDQPVDLILAQNLNLYVADFYNSRLQQYDRNMNFIRTIPLEDNDSGILYYPRSVDQAPSGWLYVLDAEQNQLLQMNPQGDVLQSIGTFAQMGKELQRAQRLRVHPNGNVWVLTATPGRIEIFDQFGTPMRTLQTPLIRNPVSLVFMNQGALILNRDGTAVFYSAERDYRQLLVPFVMKKNQQAVDISRSRNSIYLLLRNPVQIYQLNYKAALEN